MLPWPFAVGLLFLLLKGCMSALRGPAALSGFLGSSLTVTCQYDDGYQTYKKYWCKGSIWSYCRIVVKTTGSEAEAEADRISIKDNHTTLEFTVTLENLLQQDAGIYWCGIEQAGGDPGFRVNITALPEPTTSTVPVTTAYASTVADFSTPSPAGISLPVTTILLPALALVLLILLIAALLLMRKLKKQKAAKAQVNIPLSLAAKHKDSATVKAKQRTHKTAPPQDRNNTEQVEYAVVTKSPRSASQSQVPTNTEDISYASISFPGPDEEAVYANVK